MSLTIEASYTIGSDRCICSGIMVRRNGFDVYLAGRVRERHYDIGGRDRLIEDFSDVYTTGFGPEELESTVPDSRPTEPWNIGESFAECFLEDHRSAKFPYHTMRDLKNPNASPAGADLAGYFYQNDTVLFLFGEVKTSAEEKHPPSVVESLRTQLEKLESGSSVRNLIYWLAGKVQHLNADDPDKQNFAKAACSYANGEIKIVGVLVMGTSPDRRDVERMFERLKRGLQQQILLELLALYLPVAVGELPEIMEGDRRDRE